MSLEGRIYVLKQAYSHSYATTVTGTCQGVLPFGRVGPSSWGLPGQAVPASPGRNASDDSDPTSQATPAGNAPAG